MSDIPLLGQDAARERTSQSAPAASEIGSADNSAPRVVSCRSAFLVLWTLGGEVAITADLTTVIMAEREPTRDEIFAAGHIIAKDRAIEETIATAVEPIAVAASDRVIELVAFKQAQAIKAQQDAAIKAQLAKGNKHA